MDTGTTYVNGKKEERISIRLEPEVKMKIAEAAAIDHRSLTSFIIKSAIASAESIINRENNVLLGEKDWNILYDALVNPPKPNQALSNAFADYNAASIKSDV